jgi:hypothetical protein
MILNLLFLAAHKQMLLTLLYMLDITNPTLMRNR